LQAGSEAWPMRADDHAGKTMQVFRRDALSSAFHPRVEPTFRRTERILQINGSHVSGGSRFGRPFARSGERDAP
jgi:hypothetical protein